MPHDGHRSRPSRMARAIAALRTRFHCPVPALLVVMPEPHSRRSRVLCEVFAPALVGEHGGLSSRALTFAVGAADGARVSLTGTGRARGCSWLASSPVRRRA